MTAAEYTPRPPKTARFHPDASLDDNWDKADPLSFGWFGYAPIELIEQYRDAGRLSEQRSAYLRHCMQKEVSYQIASGNTR